MRTVRENCAIELHVMTFVECVDASEIHCEMRFLLELGIPGIKAVSGEESEARALLLALISASATPTSQDRWLPPRRADPGPPASEAVTKVSECTSCAQIVRN